MNDYYAYDPSYDSGDDEILGESKRRKRFIKAGRTFLQMQRPHFDADALLYGAARHGIHRLRKAASNRRKNGTFRLKEA